MEDGLPPIWKCKKCLQYKKKSGGWTNLLNHLKACVGPKYQEEYVQVVKDNVFAAFKPTVSKREADMFGWIEWVVMRNMPFAEVDEDNSNWNALWSHHIQTTTKNALFASS